MNALRVHIEELQYKGLDTVFVGYSSYQNVWAKDAAGSFIQVGEGLKTHENKQPLYEAHYGLGCVTTSAVIRTGRIVGGRVGILTIDQRAYTLKADAKSERLISAIYEQLGKANVS